jgi:hypothetical protein
MLAMRMRSEDGQVALPNIIILSSFLELVRMMSA